MELVETAAVEDRLKEYEELFRYRYCYFINSALLVMCLSDILYMMRNTMILFNGQRIQLHPL